MAGRPSGPEVLGWAAELERVADRIGRHFVRTEPRTRAVGYVRGLLSRTERKNGWQLAEYLGDLTPDGVQYLLARANWDVDAVRDELITYVAEELGTPEGMLIVDESGFPKKGTKSCGVARQYSGTADRIENSQIGVFLAYASAKGRALIDRTLYLPKEWTDNRERCDEAGVPKDVGFATKLVLARQMIERAVTAGVPAKWVMSESVYGLDFSLRNDLEKQGLGYVVALGNDFANSVGFREVLLKAMLDGVPSSAWHRLSCGTGMKGLWMYDWAIMPVNCPCPKTYARWMLIRRKTTDPTDVTYFACGGPP